MPTNFIHQSIATIKARRGSAIHTFEAMMFYGGADWDRAWYLLNNKRGFEGKPPETLNWRELGYKNSWCIGRDWTPGGDDIISIRIKPKGFFTRKLNYAT